MKLKDPEMVAVPTALKVAIPPLVTEMAVALLLVNLVLVVTFV